MILTADKNEHLNRHLTDGCWHDSCAFCLNRRRYGGTGVPADAVAADPSEAGTYSNVAYSGPGAQPGPYDDEENPATHAYPEA